MMITIMISPAILFIPFLEAYFPYQGKERIKKREACNVNYLHRKPQDSF